MKDIIHTIVVFILITSPVWFLWYIHSNHTKDVRENCVKTEYYTVRTFELIPIVKCNRSE